MAHLIVEYTANLKAEADIPALLEKANDVLIEQDGVFPIGGIRSRAIELDGLAHGRRRGRLRVRARHAQDRRGPTPESRSASATSCSR